MIPFLRTYSAWLMAIASIVLVVFYYNQIFTTNHFDELTSIQKKMNHAEKTLNEELQKSIKAIKNKRTVSHLKAKPGYFVHVYKDEQLVYWNTNKLPISRYSDINYPTSGITRLQNGWYFSNHKKIDNYTVAIAFKFKNKFSFQNEYLENNFIAPFKPSFQSSMSVNESEGFPIYSLNKKYLFSYVVKKHQPASVNETIILTILILIPIIFFCWKINLFISNYQTWLKWLLPLVFIGIRWLSIQFSWFGFFSGSEIYNPSLYGTNSIFPNFFEYILNIVLIFLIAHFIYLNLAKIKHIQSRVLPVIFGILSYLFWIGIYFLFQSLVINSRIIIHLESVFKSGIFSLIALTSIALLGFSYFVLLKAFIKYLKTQNITFNSSFISNIILSIAFAISATIYFDYHLAASLFPWVFSTLILSLEYFDFKQKHLVIGTALLFVFSLVCAISLENFNSQKEKSERELYSSQLISDKNISAEVEFSNLAERIKADKFLKRMISSESLLDVSKFSSFMERKHFHGTWESYECKFFLFGEKNQSLLKIQTDPKKQLNYLNNIIEKHGVASRISSTIFYISDYTNQYSYVIRLNLIGKHNEKATLYVTLKSKKIPEEIGYPRLLLTSQASVLSHLENYSIGKYYHGELTSSYGKFNYPRVLNSISKYKNQNTAFFDFNKNNHYIQEKGEKNAIILSIKNHSYLDYLTAFSYLFCFFGLLLLPFYIRYYTNSSFNNTISLASKIQLFLVLIVSLSLIISAISSGIFVKKQFEEVSEMAITEKVNSIQLILNEYTNDIDQLNIENNRAYLNFKLISLAKIFKTDINIYDADGFLVSTSRQNVFNNGLLSEQINTTAKHKLKNNNQNSFIHVENIGKLKYNSAYAPIINAKNDVIGYLNLQHFGQQEEAELQIQRFFVSVINIFVLLLAISVVVSLIVSNWITNPLKLLQERFSQIHIGKSNQAIHYKRNDEIGALVHSYNEKIEELEYAAQQLAQSERESAWRDMAKQVAHEIKNPLTPMKLTVQQLLRSFDPKSEDAQERIQKVGESLVEQIDAITKITNEFSNFAKMNKPNFAKTDIIQVIQNAIELYRHDSKFEIRFQTKQESCYIHGDKEQLLRVFNNLIKNSVQAIDLKPNGWIEITCSETLNEIVIKIRDNGVGMEEELLTKIFVPYFTSKSNGSGIGLAMVKQIVKNHHGEISCESFLNVGTTFHLLFHKKS